MPCTTGVARTAVIGRDGERDPVESEEGEAAELWRDYREDPDAALDNPKRLPERDPLLGVRGPQDGRPGGRVEATSVAFSVHARMTKGTGMVAIKTQTSANHVHGSRPWRRRNSIEATSTMIPSTTPATQLARRFVPAGSGERGARATGATPGGPDGPCQLECDACEVTMVSHGERRPGVLAERCAFADCYALQSCDGNGLRVACEGDRVIRGGAGPSGGTVLRITEPLIPATLHRAQ